MHRSLKIDRISATHLQLLLSTTCSLSNSAVDCEQPVTVFPPLRAPTVRRRRRCTVSVKHIRTFPHPTSKCNVSGCVQPTQLSWLPVLSNVAPPSIRRKVATDKVVAVSTHARTHAHTHTTIRLPSVLCWTRGCQTGVLVVEVVAVRLTVRFFHMYQHDECTG